MWGAQSVHGTARKCSGRGAWMSPHLNLTATAKSLSWANRRWPSCPPSQVQVFPPAPRRGRRWLWYWLRRYCFKNDHVLGDFRYALPTTNVGAASPLLFILHALGACMCKAKVI